MEDVHTSTRVTPDDLLRDQRLTAGLIAQYIHELSGRHAAARPDRAQVREAGSA